jgi:hypothetical protein
MARFLALPILASCVAIVSSSSPDWPRAADINVSAGSHRYVLRVDAPGFWRVTLEWRLPHWLPGAQPLVIGPAGKQARCCCAERAALWANAESGSLVFHAPTPGSYAVYPLPHRNPTTYPWVDAPLVGVCDDTDTCNRVRSAQNLTGARVSELQHRRSGAHAVSPLLKRALRAELDALLASAPGRAVFLFAEPAHLPVRRFDIVPESWALRGPTARFRVPRRCSAPSGACRAGAGPVERTLLRSHRRHAQLFKSWSTQRGPTSRTSQYPVATLMGCAFAAVSARRVTTPSAAGCCTTYRLLRGTYGPSGFWLSRWCAKATALPPQTRRMREPTSTSRSPSRWRPTPLRRTP